KPQTREAAVVMLADGIEAATRALKEPTKEGVEERARAILRAKMEEGQLVESSITLKDLEQVMQAFLDVLRGQFHERIEYPEP
ncbi:MAG: phosphohydrolase, partial [Clostridia bacterium]|nr:phosphohydrolase [Clostridia bacterium]